MFIKRYNSFNKINEENADSMSIIIKNNILKIFENNNIGIISNIDVRNNYTNISIKTSFYDDLAKYILYLKLDNIDSENEIKYILKKYDSDTTDLIGILEGDIKTIDDVNEEFFIDLKTKIDEKFSSDDDDLGIEFKQ